MKIINIKNYLNNLNKVKLWPSKKTVKIEVLKYLATKISDEVNYTEKEINCLLSQWHTFNDPALLRRELFENKFLDRMRDGSKY